MFYECYVGLEVRNLQFFHALAIGIQYFLWPEQKVHSTICFF